VGLLGRLIPLGRQSLDADLELAVARAVDKVDPLLRQMGGYPERYAKGVAHALDYARKLADQIPGPISIDREHFATDPTVHALFGSIDAVKAAMCASQAMREYTQACPAAQEVYALMGMRRRERGSLGMEMEGEILRRDVPQTLVYFSDHTIAEPAETETESRERIAWSLFDSLVEHVRKRVDARREEKLALEREKDETMARLHGGSAQPREALQAKLQATLARLTEVTASLDLRRYPDDFDAVFLVPQEHVYLNEIAMVLDGMGVLRAEGESVDGKEVHFADLVGRDRRRWSVTLVHCQGIGRPTMAEQLEKANRWLAI
jgi:hypothetical protein